MSNLFEIFPSNHPVFAGGRYLKVIDHLHDIDHFEHSILMYLDSLMPYDKGFVDHPAFPSIATISRATKICESTVRKKIRQLEKKGYLRVKAMRFLNCQREWALGRHHRFNSFARSDLRGGTVDWKEGARF
jgi:hypothetical protein